MSDFHTELTRAGLLPKHVQDDGRWHRCPTTDKPRHKNGAFKLLPGGQVGFYQNHRLHEEVIVWKDDRVATESRRRDIQQLIQRTLAEQASERAAAARLAFEIVSRCVLDHHPYLDKKGFPDEKGLVDYDGRLVVPMRPVDDYARRITSVQQIDSEGKKLFLKGGAAGGTAYILGSGTDFFLCEGFATGLSIRAALGSLYRPGKVVVCFSAGNLKTVANKLKGRRFVVADHDESGTGEREALATGLPWCMPPDAGDDANDFHLKHGVRALAEMMREMVIGA